MNAGLDARALAARIVEDCAPEERPFFELSAEAFYRQRTVRLVRRRRRSEPAGFGVAEATTLVTPVVLTIVTGTATDLLAGWLRHEGTGLRARWRAWRTHRRRIKPAPTAVVQLPPGADTEELSARVSRAAMLLGLSAEQASTVAEAMCSALVKADPQ